jgi:hypothetical protein
VRPSGKTACHRSSCPPGAQAHRNRAALREGDRSAGVEVTDMSFIKTVAPEEAGDELKAIYEQDLKSQGYIANYTRTMSLRPKAIAAWRVLSRTVRSTMNLRRYELVTIATAVALRCTY